MNTSRIAFLLVTIVILPSVSRSQVTQEWIARTDSVAARGIAVDSNGNVYVAGGIYRGTSGFNMALIKYDATGAQQWMREFNGIGDDLDDPTAIALDASGNIFVTGYSFRGPALLNYEIVTIKYNPNGDSLWVRRYNGTGTRDDRAFALAVDSAGNAYVGGYINNVSLSNVYGEDYITIKYSPDGTQLWAAPVELVWGSVTALAVDPNGIVYVTGVGYDPSSTSSEYITVKYGSIGNVIWLDRFDGPGTGSDEAKGIALDDSGNVYITGVSAGSNGYYDYVTIKYNEAGVEQWVRRYDGPVSEDDKAIGIVVDDSQNVYVTGTASVVSGSFVKDFATIKYNRDGDTLWVKLYNGPGNSLDEPVDLAIDTDAGIYVTGRSIGTGFSGYPDYATIKYGADGDSLWLQRYNAADLNDGPEAIAVDQFGNVYVTGNSEASFTANGAATIKYSQTPVPVAQSTAVPSIGMGSTTPFGSTHVTFIGDVTVSDSVTMFYYLEPPIPGMLPSGIIRIGDFYWRVLNGGIVFTNGYMRIATEDLFGVTAGGCGACLVWLKRDNPGDPWQNIGGIVNGTLENGTLASTTPFGSFSEFAIGSSDSITLEVEEDLGPFTFALAQNYPNPFNPSTTLMYELRSSSHVALTVFNILGEAVATPVDQVQPAGIHRVSFNGSGLSSGVYIYRMNVNGFCLTKRMILVK